ncbi:MAG: glycosyltransferase family 4 protein [Burkholderiales bacterium]|nr:glycosyltransferase family 4 protein [Bacteroidia bacterium]
MGLDLFKKYKILYLHGRPSAHPLHASFARSLNARFHYIDSLFRWQDKNYGAFVKLFAWFINIFSVKNVRSYDIVWVDGLHFTPILMRKLGIIKRNRKIVAHMGSHTLYFMYANQYSSFNIAMHKWLFRNYDAFFCEGQMAADLVMKMTDKHPKLYTTFLGPTTERFPVLLSLKTDLNTKNIIVIAGGSSDFRIYYKGLDLMIKAFSMAFAKDADLCFYILGHWEDEQRKKLVSQYSKEVGQAIIFTGNVDNIEKYFAESSLYLHCSRGDAFPTSTIEAMVAGLPTIVSEWTGTKEIIEKISDQFITKLDENEIADKISWYFNLPLVEKSQYSDKFRSIAKNYSEATAVQHYISIFDKFIQETK